MPEMGEDFIMPRGPLPDPNHRHRNISEIPTTSLPKSGYKGVIPSVPSWMPLGKAGKAWWRWAWRTPQAAAWGAGQEVFLARRAALEDALAAMEEVNSLDALDLLPLTTRREIKSVIGALSSVVTGRLAMCREMRECDDRLGLTPKGMASLRWKIVEDVAARVEVSAEGVASLHDRRVRLRDAS